MLSDCNQSTISNLKYWCRKTDIDYLADDLTFE